jgi:hypothetical protein
MWGLVIALLAPPASPPTLVHSSQCSGMRFVNCREAERLANALEQRDWNNIAAAIGTRAEIVFSEVPQGQIVPSSTTLSLGAGTGALTAFRNKLKQVNGEFREHNCYVFNPFPPFRNEMMCDFEIANSRRDDVRRELSVKLVITDGVIRQAHFNLMTWTKGRQGG